jgi:hypothetical protein
MSLSDCIANTKTSFAVLAVLNNQSAPLIFLKGILSQLADKPQRSGHFPRIDDRPY